MFRCTVQIILMFCLLFWSHDVLADCRLSMRGLPSEQQIVVDAETIATNDVAKTITFSVHNAGSSTCYYFVTIK